MPKKLTKKLSTLLRSESFFVGLDSQRAPLFSSADVGKNVKIEAGRMKVDQASCAVHWIGLVPKNCTDPAHV